MFTFINYGPPVMSRPAGGVLLITEDGFVLQFESTPNVLILEPEDADISN